MTSYPSRSRSAAATELSTPAAHGDDDFASICGHGADYRGKSEIRNQNDEPNPNDRNGLSFQISGFGFSFPTLFLPPMRMDVTGPAARLREAITRILSRFGFQEDSFLLILAVIVGMVTAVAAVGFHELILLVRNELYYRTGEDHLYRGTGMLLLLAFPIAGGLVVGIISRYLFRIREGHGIVDVMESVVRTSGFQSPLVALEKILTAGVTIGSGGSAGAEGPIVQIGAGIASGIGAIFSRGAQPDAGADRLRQRGGNQRDIQRPIRRRAVHAGGHPSGFFDPRVYAGGGRQRHRPGQRIAFVQADASRPGISSDLRYFPRCDPGPRGAAMGAGGEFRAAGTRVRIGRPGPDAADVRLGSAFDRIKIPRVLKPALGGAVLGTMGILYIIVFGWVVLKRDQAGAVFGVSHARVLRRRIRVHRAVAYLPRITRPTAWTWEKS